MRNSLNLKNLTPKKIHGLGPGFEGTSRSGRRLSFTNYYMELDGEPFYGISGEFHFSRYRADSWYDELLKMKAGGVNIVSTYVFWNHHEEEEGVFRFEGRRDLRRFVDLCARAGLFVIVRIGPFNHGEVRNGGLPDWLYGKPYEVRTTQEGFLERVAALYGRIHEQLEGYYFSQDGPIIAAQIDNEYMHSAAPWEITSGVTNEWLPAGSEGDAYMLRLLELAREKGIVTPFYTCTGWGGAATPPELLPLWGGYAFRPWIFYSYKGEHPATEEYLYRDNHNNAVPATYNFEPFYEPESKPYLCCEMGGGMTCCYYYRFQLPFESVDAMANIKIGSGCNMLGYYMYHGGTNPTGRAVTYLNEGQVPKLSYDYQAAIGEFGQIRPSYHRLRRHHYLVQNFFGVLSRAKTYLPENSQNIAPEDPEPLRYAVRCTPEGEGFLFINNYQDHARTADKKGRDIRLDLPDRTIFIDGIDMDAGENGIFPFAQTIGGIPFEYALAQPLGVIVTGEGKYAFFFTPAGMAARYRFDPGVTLPGDSALTVTPEPGKPFTVACGDNRLTVVTLTREESLNFYLMETPRGKAALMTEGALLIGEKALGLESFSPDCSLRTFPAGILGSPEGVERRREGEWEILDFSRDPLDFKPDFRKTGTGRYVVDLPEFPDGAKEIVLEVDYDGDIAHAFIDGKMVADNFANGALWEIGLKELADKLMNHPLTITITPLKEGGKVNAETLMAGRSEVVDKAVAEIKEIRVKILSEWKVIF